MSDYAGLEPDAARTACMDLIAAFKALERRAGRRRLARVTPSAQRFFTVAMPLFEYLFTTEAPPPRL